MWGIIKRFMGNTVIAGNWPLLTLKWPDNMATPIGCCGLMREKKGGMSPSAPLHTHTNAATGSLCKVQPWVSIDIAPPLLASFPQHTLIHTHPPERSLRGQRDYQGGVGQKKGDNYHIIQTIKETFCEQQLMVLCMLSVWLTFSWTHLWSVVLVPGVCMHGTSCWVPNRHPFLWIRRQSRFYWPGRTASRRIWLIIEWKYILKKFGNKWFT